MSNGLMCIEREAQNSLELAQSSENVPEVLTGSIKRVNRLLGDYRDYLEKIASPVSKDVSSIVDFTNKNDWEKFAEEHSTEKFGPGIMTGGQGSQVLRMLVSMSRATRVLEIGMFTGCAALAMAEALPSNGTVVTCDIEAVLEPVVRGLVDRSPHGKKIKIKIGPALETMKALSADGQQFDFVFIDADKTGYLSYFKIRPYLLDSNLLAPGGTICCDNALWDGNAYLPREERDTDMPPVHAIPEFNEAVFNDDRVYTVLLPVRDGMLIIRRKEDVDVDK